MEVTTKGLSRGILGTTALLIFIGIPIGLFAFKAVTKYQDDRNRPTSNVTTSSADPKNSGNEVVGRTTIVPTPTSKSVTNVPGRTPPPRNFSTTNTKPPTRTVTTTPPPPQATPTKTIPPPPKPTRNPTT